MRPRAAPAGTSSTRQRGLILAGVYVVFAVIGLISTWYFNLQFSGSEDQNYVQAWFANPASSSAAVDVIVTAVVACVFYVREGARLGLRWAVALIPLTFLVALAFTFPLFLALRELRMSGAEPSGQERPVMGSPERASLG